MLGNVLVYGRDRERYTLRGGGRRGVVESVFQWSIWGMTDFQHGSLLGREQDSDGSKWVTGGTHRPWGNFIVPFFLDASCGSALELALVRAVGAASRTLREKHTGNLPPMGSVQFCDTFVSATLFWHLLDLACEQFGCCVFNFVFPTLCYSTIFSTFPNIYEIHCH